MKRGFRGKWRHSSGKSSWTYSFSNCPREQELAVGFSVLRRGGSVVDPLWLMYTLYGINVERVCKFMKPEIRSLWPVWGSVCWCKRVWYPATRWGLRASWRARCVTGRRLWSLYWWGTNWVDFVCCGSWTPPSWGVNTRVVVCRRGLIVGGWLRERLLWPERWYSRAVPRWGYRWALCAVLAVLAVGRPVGVIVVVIHEFYRSTPN